MDDDHVTLTLDERPTNPQRLGRYEVRALLGQGGFGRVYSGFDPELQRPVAIKVPLVRGSEEQQQRFLIEARRLAKLRHPGIVTLHDVGVESGLCFLVSELLTGVDLGHWLRAAPRAWPAIVATIAAIADALAYAHANTTVHRDVKPSNVMITSEGHPVLLDFGLALNDVEEGGPDRRPIGTPVYMSPEQTEGAAHRIDGRTDIYSLGVVLYEALCGRLPFRVADSHELCRQIREDEPQPPRQLVPSLPRELERICVKAMSKRMHDRHANASDFAAELRHVLREEGEGAAAISYRQRTPQLGPRAVERRHVTVLSCDFDLANALAMDPEDQLRLTIAFRQSCAEVALRHQATTLPAGGNSVLLCFGFPQAFEDAAMRAVRTALDVQAATETLRAHPRSPSGGMSILLTIHSSIALVGAAEKDGPLDIVGEARTVATRLEGIARPGAVTITEATHKLVAGFFECVPTGPCTVKGVSQPIELFEVLRALPVQNRIEIAGPAALSPLIGRDQEVGLLLDRWEQVAEGRGQIVLLVGEPGIGKSRLVHVLKERVMESPTQAVIEWRCSPYHENSSLHPAIEFFERTLSFTPELSAEERMDRLSKYLATYAMDDAVPLFAALLSIPGAQSVLGATLSPQRQKERTLEVVLEWMRRSSQHQPTLVIVEDLHWIDASTLELLGMLAAQVKSERLLALCTFRPEFSLRWGASAHLTQVVLHRLSRRQATDLISRTAASLPEGVVDQLATRTDGVPLFIEEFTRTVVESGKLAGEIPTTLHDLLMARLDRISSVRELVWVAATLGREFSYDMLSEASGLESERLDQELAKLVDAEILYRRGRVPRCTYLFKHALIQDAAYQSMIKPKRQQLHRAIAHLLEERFRAIVEAEPELVAHHCTEAGDTERAVSYWERAGTRSRERSAMPEAIGHFRRGLELLATLEESADRDRQELRFQTQLAVALTSARGWASPEVESVHARARELCVRLHDDASLFHVMWGTWAWRLLRRELDMARALSDELLVLAEAKKDPGWLTEACWAIGCTSLFRGDFARGHEAFQRANELHDPDRSREHAQLTGQDSGATLGAHWGWLLWHLGFPDRALARGREGVARSKTMAHPFSEAFALYHLGCVYQHCGMTDETIAMADATLAIGDEQGFAIFKGLGTLCRGAGLAMAGRHDEGVALIRAGLGGFEATGAGLSATHYFCRLAEALLASGHRDEAARAVENGLAIAETSNERFVEAELHRLRGEVGSEHERVSSFRRAIEIAKRQGAKSWELRATTSLCRTLPRDEARRMLSAILDWFTEGFDTRDVIEARALLATLID